MPAAADSGTVDIAAWLVAQGPVGALALVIGYGWKRERDRADAAVADKDRMVQSLIDRVVPALTESTAATRALLDARRNHG